MAPLKVTVVATSYPLNKHETSGIFISRLCEQFSENVHVNVITPGTQKVHGRIRNGKVDILAFRYAPSYYQVLAHRPGGIPVALKNNKLNYLLVAPLLMAMFFHTARAARSSDVIHANWAITSIVAGLGAKICRRPLITTLRGEDVTRAYKSKLYRLLLRACLYLSTSIVTVSYAMLDRVGNSFPAYRNKLSVIENGIDHTFLDVGFKRDTYEISNVFTIVTVCSLIPRKGIDQIIRALSKLKDLPDIVLQIVGDGPEKNRLLKLIRDYSLSEKVQFLGKMNPEQIPSILGESDVFVLASSSEGRPNVILEAMAAALPIVATDIDGVKEIVQNDETGLLYTPGNIDQLAANIARLHEDILIREQLGKQAHNYIIQNRLLWKETAKKYLKLYQATS